MPDENIDPTQPVPPQPSAWWFNGVRFRTAAASSVLAAVSVTGIGAAAAQASEAGSSIASITAGEQSESAVGAAAPTASVPTVGTTAVPAAATSAALPAVQGASSEERLAGVRQDLANAVAWGSVTAEQAAHFYAQISARIARGL